MLTAKYAGSANRFIHMIIYQLKCVSIPTRLIISAIIFNKVKTTCHYNPSPLFNPNCKSKSWVWVVLKMESVLDLEILFFQTEPEPLKGYFRHNSR